MAILEQPAENPYLPIEEQEAEFGSTWNDSAALKLVVQDAELAERFVESRRWLVDWDGAELLFQAPAEIRFWEGTRHPRAHVSVPLVLQHVESIMPQVMSGIFGDTPPFQFQPRSGTKAESARAAAQVVGFEIEDIRYREQFRLLAKNCLTYGIGIGKWGWEQFSRERRIYGRKQRELQVSTPFGAITQPTVESDRLHATTITEDVARPTFESLNPRFVLVDPSLRETDIRQAKYVIHRMYLSADDLDRLRGFEGYDIPSRDELRALFFPPREQAEVANMEAQTITEIGLQSLPMPRGQDATNDPLGQPLEVLERWDGERVITVLQKKLVIRNEPNEFGRHPFVSCSFVDVPDSFFGLGLAQLIGGEQRLQQSLINARLDEVAINLNGMFIRQRGRTAPAQNIRMRPGGIIDVDDKDALTVLPRLQAVPEAYVEVQASQQRAEQTSAANELIVQGSLPSSGRSSITRTATGVQALTGGSGARLQYFVESLAENVFVPTLNAFHEMNQAKMPLPVLRRILSEEMAEAYQGDHMDVLNARLSFSVLAGAKMQAKRAMAQALPIMFQFLLTEPVAQQLNQQGLQVNVAELVRMLFEVSGWTNRGDVLQKMAPEDHARMMLNNPGVQQMLAQRQQGAIEGQNQAAGIDQETAGRAARRVLETILRHVEQPEMEGGAPGNVGFGSSEP